MNKVNITPESFQPLQKRKLQEETIVSRGTWYYVKRGFLENPIAIVCVVLLIVITAASLMAPLSPYDPDAMNLMAKYKDPDLK